MMGIWIKNTHFYFLICKFIHLFLFIFCHFIIYISHDIKVILFLWVSLNFWIYIIRLIFIIFSFSSSFHLITRNLFFILWLSILINILFWLKVLLWLILLLRLNKIWLSLNWLLIKGLLYFMIILLKIISIIIYMIII